MSTASGASESVEGGYDRTVRGRYYDLLFAGKDYAADGATLRTLLNAENPTAATLLDIGCATGRHLEYLRDEFDVSGLDLSAELIAQARGRLPGVPLHVADMRDFNLGQTFDVVTCLMAVIGYALTLSDLQRSIQNMTKHLSPDGVLIVEPWLLPDSFIDGRVVHNVVGQPELAVSSMYVQRRVGDICVFDVHSLVATPEEGVVYSRARQEIALFTDDEYRAAFALAGLVVRRVDPGLHGYGLYIARRQGSRASTANVNLP